MTTDKVPGRKHPAARPLVGPLIREELAWAAGFWDGEGCTYLRKAKPGGAKNNHATLNVGQVDRRPLERFHRAVGELGTLHGPYTRKQYDNYKRKDFSHWSCASFEEVQAVAAMLWPFLCRPKQDQIKRVMAEVTFS